MVISELLILKAVHSLIGLFRKKKKPEEVDGAGIQREQYRRIAKSYDEHYNDKYSRLYHEEFIYGPLFGIVDLNDKFVLEACCGSGETTEYLQGRGARVVGLDISREAMSLFKKNHPGCKGVCKPLSRTGFEDDSFDVVVIIGGLHHTHPDLKDSVREVVRVLRPGGFLCFNEPYTGSLVNVLREEWYKRDDMFASNEAAIDLDRLKSDFGDEFFFLRENCVGGLAYYLVLNTLIFRIPVRFKKYYARPLLWVERITKPFILKFVGATNNSIWKKKLNKSEG